MSSKIGTWPSSYSNCTRLAWKGKLDLLTDADMLLMVEKEIRRGKCHAVHEFARANNKYMENYDKNKEW